MSSPAFYLTAALPLLLSVAVAVVISTDPKADKCAELKVKVDKEFEQSTNPIVSEMLKRFFVDDTIDEQLAAIVEESCERNQKDVYDSDRNFSAKLFIDAFRWIILETTNDGLTQEKINEIKGKDSAELSRDVQSACGIVSNLSGLVTEYEDAAGPTCVPLVRLKQLKKICDLPSSRTEPEAEHREPATKLLDGEPSKASEMENSHD